MKHEQVELVELGFTVDVGLEDLIRACWRRGIATKYSCIGSDNDNDPDYERMVWLNFDGGQAARRWGDLTGDEVFPVLDEYGQIITSTHFERADLPMIMSLLEALPAPKTAIEIAVWDAWGDLDDCASPVKTIAKQLGMTNANVAFIVYPAEQFEPWADDQEPDI